jgi:hypothetical protein
MKPEKIIKIKWNISFPDGRKLTIMEGENYNQALDRYKLELRTNKIIKIKKLINKNKI